MGTKEQTVELQSKIKKLAAEIGWSHNKLAKVLYAELNEFDDDDEIASFQERFKKDLQRPTVKVDRLKIYLDVILRQPEAELLDVVFNKYIPQKSITCSLSKVMREISQEIDNA